ncbi:hypothetical protein [Agrobacterium vitis]|uniref:hypothetical protein n=1 Tax=Agrobacterium vitis TaxID=373 RepID=UPI00087245C0|nr:hypothetical protein [Agrobacterium vitis]MUO72916.1 hypothetical protein [Agrobacterium vitis]
MAERKYAGPKLPATLGNVALKVSEYVTKDGVTTVKGNHLQTGDELSIQLMSPVRAANMMKGRNDVDDRERIRIWEDRFANRRDLTVFSDQSNEHGVKPGGVLLLNNTRLDFSDRRYYAQAAYGFVSDPEAQAAISGMISLSKFNDGSVRLQVFQPENASLLSASDKDAAQQSVKAAFEARCPVGSGVMARAVIVTLKEAGSEGQSKAFYMRSASFEADSGNGVQFQLSNGFGDTLKRTNLDSNSGAGAAAIAAATGVSVQMVLDRLGADATEEDRDSLKKIYDAVASGATSAALTPGYTIPIVLKSVEHLSKRPELFHSGAFSGAVAIAVRGAGGGALERPAAYAVTSYSTLPKSEPENAPTPAKEAIKVHDRLVSSTGGSAEVAPASRPPTRFASPGRDF